MSPKPGYSVQNGESRSGPRDQLDFYSEVVRPTVDDGDLERSNYGLGNYSSREFYQQIETFVEGMYADAAFSRLIFERAVYETKRALAAEQWAGLGEDELLEYLREFVDDRDDQDDEPRGLEALIGNGSADVLDEGADDRGDEGDVTEELVELLEDVDAEVARRAYIREHMDEVWAALECDRDDVDEETREYLTTQNRILALQENAGIARDWKPPQHRTMDFKHEASRSRGARLMDNAFGRVQRYETDSNAEELQRRLGGR